MSRATINRRPMTFRHSLLDRAVFVPYGPGVYFIAAGPYVKIGWSKQPSERLCRLQVANPLELEMIALVSADRAAEDMFHRIFGEHHVRGEWFHRAPIQAWIDSRPAPADDCDYIPPRREAAL